MTFTPMRSSFDIILLYFVCVISNGIRRTVLIDPLVSPYAERYHTVQVCLNALIYLLYLSSVSRHLSVIDVCLCDLCTRVFINILVVCRSNRGWISFSVVHTTTSATYELTHQAFNKPV
jgi:hypothetical protein